MTFLGYFSPYIEVGELAAVGHGGWAGAKSTLTVAPKPTQVAQADFGRNLKPAPAAKLLVFSDFSFALAFQKVLFVFCILSPPRVAQSRLL
jgi:hypothetical protein